MHNHRYAPLNLFLAQTQTPSILCFTLFHSLSPLFLFGRHVVTTRNVAFLVVIIADDPLQVGALEFLEHNLLLLLTTDSSSVSEKVSV